jgi:hypothetical protein
VDDVCHSLVARPDNANWTIVTAAPVTSQVIGVFTAVVFTGVILLFQQAPPSEDSDHYRYSSRALVTMLCSFVSLSLASFLFSVVSGEELCGRAFGEGVAAGALFGIGATGMFLSICWLFAAQRIGGHTVIWVKALMVGMRHRTAQEPEYSSSTAEPASTSTRGSRRIATRNSATPYSPATCTATASRATASE